MPEEEPKLMRETINGPSVPDEEILLAALFGPADSNGIYGAVDDANLPGEGGVNGLS